MSIVEGSSSSLRVGMRSPGRLAFLSRNSQGSMPSTVALRVICSSIANDAEVTPKPRMAVVGTWFVQTT